MYNVYVIMKTMYPPGYHHDGFVATHALGHMMYGYALLVPINQRVLNKLSKEHSLVHWYQQCITAHIYIIYITYIYHNICTPFFVILIFPYIPYFPFVIQGSRKRGRKEHFRVCEILLLF